MSRNGHQAEHFRVAGIEKFQATVLLRKGLRPAHSGYFVERIGLRLGCAQ